MSQSCPPTSGSQSILVDHILPKEPAHRSGIPGDRRYHRLRNTALNWFRWSKCESFDCGWHTRWWSSQLHYAPGKQWSGSHRRWCSVRLPQVFVPYQTPWPGSEHTHPPPVLPVPPQSRHGWADLGGEVRGWRSDVKGHWDRSCEVNIWYN